MQIVGKKSIISAKLKSRISDIDGFLDFSLKFYYILELINLIDGSH